MEIPSELKNLYKHREYHTVKPTWNDEVFYDKKLMKEIEKFISERMKVWEKKEMKSEPPYTDDEIISRYRFCNIYRELDRQTIEIHSDLKILERDFDVWLLNLVFERMVCKPETIRKVWFLNYDEKHNKEIFEKLMDLPRPKFWVPYIFPISMVGKVGWKTREEFFCFYLPKVMKKCAKCIRTFERESVIGALKKVLPIFWVNFNFHRTEALIDVAYQFPQYIDLFGEFPIWPWSIPTMKRLNPDENPVTLNKKLIWNILTNFPYLTYDGKKVWLSAENREWIGCEFRKYTNLKAWTGRRRIYR